MKSIPESHQDLLKNETKAFVYIATLMPDGSPQVAPVWFNAEGEYILVNSAKGHVKDRNMRLRRTSRCALPIQAIPIAISKFRERLPKSPRMARMSTLTR
jgi:hypothetical protein